MLEFSTTLPPNKQTYNKSGIWNSTYPPIFGFKQEKSYFKPKVVWHEGGHHSTAVAGRQVKVTERGPAFPRRRASSCLHGKTKPLFPEWTTCNAYISTFSALRFFLFLFFLGWLFMAEAWQELHTNHQNTAPWQLHLLITVNIYIMLGPSQCRKIR